MWSLHGACRERAGCRELGKGQGRAWRGGWEGHRCAHAQDLSSSAEQVAAVREACSPTRGPPFLVQALLSALSSPSSPTGFLPRSPAPKGSLLLLSLQCLPSILPSVIKGNSLPGRPGPSYACLSPRPPGIFPLSSPQSSCCCELTGLPVRATTARACFHITRSPWQLSLS